MFWVYTSVHHILLLAGLRSLPKQPVRGGRAGRGAAAVRVLADHPAMLMPYMLTAVLFRMIESIQQKKKNSTSSTP